MRKFVGGRQFLSGALVLALLATTGLANAQERSDNPAVRRSWRNPPPTQTQPAPAAPEAPRAQTPPAAAEAPRAAQRDGRRDGGERHGRDDRNPGDQSRSHQGRGDRDGDRRYRGDHDGGGRDWNNRSRDDRNRDGWERNDGRNWHDDRRWDDPRRHQPRPRYDRRRYDPTWRTHQRYRGWVYQRPPGFYYRNWGYGDVLPRGWWGPQYRILDWWAYGLPIPPLGFEWVRVGDHALLVDMYSGRVVQVAYNLFW